MIQKATVFEFQIALQTEEEMKETVGLFESPDAGSVVVPAATKFKTLFTIADTEEEAIDRVSAYVEKTSYRDIQDNKVI